MNEMKPLIKKKFKKCPRCGNKCTINQTRCDECDLSFKRFEFASNKAAKKKIRRFDRDFIIYTNQYPKDLGYWKMMILAVLTGLVGGHYYYVGKYFKGFLMTLGFVYTILCTIFNAQLSAIMESYYLYFPIGVLTLSWMVSVILVAVKKFKVPVIVETNIEV